MKKKKLVALLLAVLAIFTLVSCGGTPVERNQSSPVDQDWSEQQEELNAAELQEDRKVLPNVIRIADHLDVIIDNAELSLDGNDLTIQVHLRPDIPSDWLKHIRMAWYLLKDEKTFIKDGYGLEQWHTFSELEPGRYAIKYYLRYNDGEQDIRKSFLTETITLSGPDEESGSAKIADAAP